MIDCPSINAYASGIVISFIEPKIAGVHAFGSFGVASSSNGLVSGKQQCLHIVTTYTVNGMVLYEKASKVKTTKLIYWVC